MIQILDGRGILEDDIDRLEEENEALRAEVERLREALRRAADEPSIDRARAIADEALK